MFLGTVFGTRCVLQTCVLALVLLGLCTLHPQSAPRARLGGCQKKSAPLGEVRSCIAWDMHKLSQNFLDLTCRPRCPMPASEGPLNMESKAHWQETPKLSEVLRSPEFAALLCQRVGRSKLETFTPQCAVLEVYTLYTLYTQCTPEMRTHAPLTGGLVGGRGGRVGEGFAPCEDICEYCCHALPCHIRVEVFFEPLSCLRWHGPRSLCFL